MLWKVKLTHDVYIISWFIRLKCLHILEYIKTYIFKLKLDILEAFSCLMLSWPGWISRQTRYSIPNSFHLEMSHCGANRVRGASQ